MFDLNDLLNNLNLERVDELTFKGDSLTMPLSHVFGGQVLGQALRAASFTVDASRQAHSMHAYFLRSGDTEQEIIYEVDPIRDGGSFTTRRVVARQKGKPIFNTTISFQQAEEGLIHQQAMPQGVPDPDTLENDAERLKRLDNASPNQPLPSLIPTRAIDIRSRYPRPSGSSSAMDPVQSCWIKLVEPIDDDPAIHRGLLAYLSDIGLLGTGFRPHYPAMENKTVQAASLDHALWFHSEFRVDEWLYYDMDSPRGAHGRSFNRGSFYNRDGILVASTAQEGLMRIKGKQ